jgi:hydroxyacylglutathione hydrolase
MEKVAGFLQDGIAGWVDGDHTLDTIPQITAQDLADLLAREPELISVLDVREMTEREGGMIEDSQSIPLGKLKSRINELDPHKLVVVHCKGGYRSSIAASLLRRAGYENVANLIGGFDAWKAANLPTAAPDTVNA